MRSQSFQRNLDRIELQMANFNQLNYNYYFASIYTKIAYA